MRLARHSAVAMLLFLGAGCDDGPMRGRSDVPVSADVARLDAPALDAPEDAEAPVLDTPPALDLGLAALPDDAVLVDAWYPPGLHPGELGRVYLVYQNTGTATWTRPSFALDPDGASALGPARTDLAAADVVAPGGRISFLPYIFAPDAAGSYPVGYRMTHDGVGAFGAASRGDAVVVPDSALCPDPAPPPLDHFNVNVLNDMGFRKVLDSTPLVWADGGVYCATIGFTDGRRRCPPRPEGHPEVEICNDQLVGHALDTDRIGPTWTFNGMPCTDTDEPGRCRNHGSNQFLVFVNGSGWARACGRNGVCGELFVP